MLKYIKHHMETIAGIEIYPIVSFVIFFVFFLAVGILVLRAKKDYIDHVSALPMEDGVDNKIDQVS